jgi:hypothetical protein
MSGNGGAASWRGTDDEFGPTVGFGELVGVLGPLGWVIMP